MKVWFQDETRFGRISDLRRCWAPFPDRPIVGHQVIREYVYALGAVNPFEGQLRCLIMPWVDAEIMSVFLAYVASQCPGEHILMFLDGAGWHRANELRVPPTIKLSFLPPYSPELNPVEPLWRHMRENYLGNRVFDTLDEVENSVCAALGQLIRQPETVRSIACFDWLNTLSMTSN